MKLPIINKSIQQLAFTGFTLVALPLCVALVLSFFKLDDLSQQGKLAVNQVADTVKISQELQGSLLQLERYAKQYQVLGDPALLELFNVRQQEIQRNLYLLTLVGDGALQNLADEITISLRLLDNSTKNLQENQSSQVDAHFSRLDELAKGLQNAVLEQVDLNLIKIEAQSSEARFAIMQAAAVIPISLFTAFLFIYLIGRPLKQLSPQIKELEKGDFGTNINVDGAKDIVDIANTLNSMRSRLQHLESQKTSFIRQISHELKTPLAAIKESAELLHDECLGEMNQSQKEVCEILRDSTARLQKLIEDLLNFNLVLDTSSELKSEHFSIQDMANEIQAQYQLLINKKRLKIVNKLQVKRLYAQREYCRTLLDNLFSNAVKYSPENGTIYIRSENSKNGIQLIVEDQGCGVEAGLAPRIFEPFVHGPRPKNSSLHGSGLGLAICKEMVTRQGGTITQENLKKGSRFTATLPLQIPAQEINFAS